MAKHSVIKEKIEKAKRFDWRKQKEMLLGLDDRRHRLLMRKFLDIKEQELLAEERENERLGYCTICGMNMTVSGDCSSNDCLNDQAELTVDDWFDLGCQFSMRKIQNTCNDSLQEFLLDAIAI